MTHLPTVEDLFKAGAHFGHQKAKSHPKSRDSVFTVVKGIYIIDLDKSRAQVERAADFLKKQSAEAKVILLVGTKRQAKEAVEKLGKSVGLPFISNKWLGGMLTNFTTIKANLKKLEQLETQKADPEFSKKPKKVQAMVQTQIDRMHRTMDGIKNMQKLPDVLVIIDLNEEKTAVMEAKRLGIPVVGVVDTNANPNLIDYPIVVNDDSFQTVELIVKTLGEAIAEGMKLAPKPEVATEEVKEKTKTSK